MDSTKAEQVAAFRYSLIAPIVSRQTPLLPGELKNYLKETAARSYEGIGKSVSVRTLERYLAAYRDQGWEGLKPKPQLRHKPAAILSDILALAINLRRERPERSVEQIIFCLEEGGYVAPGVIASSTLSRYLKKAGFSRTDLLADPTKPSGFRRFEAADAHLSWQSDVQHTLYLPDPNLPGKKKKALLFAIMDDFSRYIVHCEFYWDEKLPRLEDSLKKAILKHGIPETFYCDNGAVFSSSHLARICGKLGIHLAHSRVRRPQGRGKIERWFRFVDTSFKPEAYRLIEEGTIRTLADLNQALTSWVDGYYHRRRHSSTQTTPTARLAACTRPIRKKTFGELAEIFLWEELRQVDKTACIKLQGNLYEVDTLLTGEKVTLRFDPFDLHAIQVWHGSDRFADAIPLDVNRPVHCRVRKLKPEIAKDTPATGISMIALAETKRRESWSQESLSFASVSSSKEGNHNEH